MGRDSSTFLLLAPTRVDVKLRKVTLRGSVAKCDRKRSDVTGRSCATVLSCWTIVAIETKGVGGV